MSKIAALGIKLILVCVLFLHTHGVRAQYDTRSPFDVLEVDHVEFPFEFYQNFIVIRARMNGLPLKLLFDTGAEHTLLFKPSFARLMRLQYSKRIPLLGADVSRDVYAQIARNVQIEIMPMRPLSHDILVLEEDFTQLDEITGTTIDGILGASFFRNFVVKIDFSKGIITFYRASEYKGPGKKYDTHPLQIINTKPYISATAAFTSSDAANTTLLMDTGAGVSLLLHANTHDAIKLPESTIPGNLGSGLGGYLKGYVGKVERVDMLNHSFNNVVTSFQDLDETFVESLKLVRNGIVGNEILSRFHIVIDYPHEKLYLRPRKNIEESFTYDRSGLTIFAVGSGLNDFLVHDVLPGSPADRAGLKSGDMIVTFQRLPANFYNLGGILSVLRKRTGKTIRLKVRRGEEKIRLNFELEELF